MKIEPIFSETEKEIISKNRKAIDDLSKGYAEKISKAINYLEIYRLEKEYYSRIEPYERNIGDVYKFHSGELKVTFESEEERKQFEEMEEL